MLFRSAYALQHDFAKIQIPDDFVQFSKKLKYLHTHKVLEKTRYDCFLNCAKERNAKLHSAMWNLDEFSRNDSLKVLKLAREMDSLVRRQKAKMKNKPNNQNHE